MTRFFLAGSMILAGVVVLSALLRPTSSPAPPLRDAADVRLVKQETDQTHFKQQAQPFFEKYCVSCHGPDKAKAKYRLDNIAGDIAAGDDTVRWEKALEMISLGDMPPEKAAQPTDEDREALSGWIAAELKKIGRGKLDEMLLHPSQGNRVDHDALFSGKHKGPASSPPRLWRLNPHAYAEMLSNDGSGAMLEKLSGHGFKDYASLRADEAFVNAMLATTDMVASHMLGEKVTLVRTGAHGGHSSKLETRRPNQKLAQFYEDDSPTDDHRKQFVVDAFQMVFDHEPSEEEHARYLALFNTGVEAAGHRIGAKTMLRGMMMSPEFIFRMEMGLGEELPDGRRMLSPMELAYAIGFAILDTGPDAELLKAAQKGRLATRQDVERETRRLLAIEEDPRNRIYSMAHKWWTFKPKKARLLRFFQEYFGYTAAVDVFKDNTRTFEGWPRHPKFYVRDADQLVLYAIKQDKQVLEFLLTTDRFFAGYSGPAEQYHEQLARYRAADPEKDRFAKKYQGQIAKGIERPPFKNIGHISSYGLDPSEWSYEPVQPFKQPVPRAGILTHPAWLIAHSGNFDNDIVRRGLWVREHLLAGVVPDLPIGVDAQLSTNPTLTLREKFKLKVYSDECWRCHNKMNPLGYAFEMYNDFGRYRTEFHYDYEGKVIGSRRELTHFQNRAKYATDRNRHEFVITTKPVDTSGKLDGTGDPDLDGDVKDAVDLMHRLGKSDIARQSFIRHAFRYWMGRNETLDDSPTLIAADKAYVESDGSFTELLVSLLTSDSFLYRKETTD